MENWKDVIASNFDVRLLDGHLVDVMGTLIGSDVGGFNRPLYDAMLNAYDKGEKVYIYSMDPKTMLPQLKEVGVDTEKFPVIPKSFDNESRELARLYGQRRPKPLYTIVTGQIIDNDDPYKLCKGIITTDENAWKKPEQSSYSFTRTDMPKELADYYHDNLLKRLNLIKELHRQGNVPYIPDIDKIIPKHTR